MGSTPIGTVLSRARWAGLASAAALAFVAASVTSGSALASPAPVTGVRVLANFSYQAGQTPESLAVEPGGAVDVSLARAAQIDRVLPGGRVQTIAQLPQSGNCPVFGLPASVGIVRLADGSLDALACDGDSDTGVWNVRPGHAPVQIAKLPADSLPNGMALDARTGYLYVADSVLGTVWRIPSRGGQPVQWAASAALLPVSRIGANGCAFFGDAVYVTNTDQGTLLRIPVGAHGTAGAVQTVATGLVQPDSFTVLPGNRYLMPFDGPNQVVLIRPGHAAQVLLTAADGLSSPVDVKLSEGTIYVADAAYVSQTGGNILAGRLHLAG